MQKIITLLLIVLIGETCYAQVPSKSDIARYEEILRKIDADEITTVEEMKWFVSHQKLMIEKGVIAPTAENTKQTQIQNINPKNINAQIGVPASNVISGVIEKKDIRSVQCVPQVGGGYAVTIEYTAKMGWNAKSTRRSLTYDFKRVAKAILADPACRQISEITLAPIAKAMDDSEFPMARMTIPRKDLDRIDFSTVLPEQLETLAQSKGKLWYHPAAR
ncbi:MAG: hypothetical protein Q7J98_01325 [Kiritimatiellia bacterium]|nr:hypothetical protein [Kiritimatiellia bacterium]